MKIINFLGFFLQSEDGKEDNAQLTAASEAGKTENKTSADVGEATKQVETPSSETHNEVEVKSNSEMGLAENVVAYRNTPTAENSCNLIVPKSLFKVCLMLVYFDVCTMNVVLKYMVMLTEKCTKFFHVMQLLT